MPKTYPHTIQIHEHQTIRVGDQLNNILFDQDTYQTLAKYQEKQKTKYFSLVYKGIKFSHYVGIIQVGKITLEILPKADKATVNNPAKWQAVLLEMLRYCRLIKIESLGVGKVRLQSNTILDIYFEQFLIAVQQLLKKGLPKQYLTKESNQKALKGRLVIPKQLRKNGLHPERFYVRHTAFEYDHLFNRVLHEALTVLQQVHLNPLLKLKLQQVLARFPKLSTYTVSAKDFDLLFQTQKYRPHHDLLEISRLILMNFSPDIRGGQHHLFALLFDMNKLFEEYVFWKLKALENEQIKVQRQASKPFWQRRTIRPDLVVQIDERRYVLDTKWKVLKSNSPSMEDLRQLYIYGQYFEAERGVLLYPKVNAIENSPSIPFQPTQKEPSSIHGQVLFLNILGEDNSLNKTIGKELLAILMNT
ncbi:MAG: McrC family protein [Saprospiraceae bacterium]